MHLVILAKRASTLLLCLQEFFPMVYTVRAEDDVNFVMLATQAAQSKQRASQAQHAKFLQSLSRQWTAIVAGVHRSELHDGACAPIHEGTVTDIHDAIGRMVSTFVL